MAANLWRRFYVWISRIFEQFKSCQFEDDALWEAHDDVEDWTADNLLVVRILVIDDQESEVALDHLTKI